MLCALSRGSVLAVLGLVAGEIVGDVVYKSFLMPFGAPEYAAFFCIGFFAVLAKAMGLPEHFTFAEATFGSSLAVMFNLLPVNGVAGVGTQEAGWVTGFSQFLGVDRSVALSTGIGCHLVQLFNVVVMGIAAHLAMGVMPRLRFDPVETKLPQ